ncbi:uncharacterized protein LOC121797439 [Salvia splendens]|uniref:uncharacterized protein LOC121797439 n=1 Tax=Salvia splendens TaxID=180675 RepID=UPI001C266281|nr:uncharacterized protein LOC121797439 [Salvia splendens]
MSGERGSSAAPLISCSFLQRCRHVPGAVKGLLYSCLYPTEILTAFGFMWVLSTWIHKWNLFFVVAGAQEWAEVVNCSSAVCCSWKADVAGLFVPLQPAVKAGKGRGGTRAGVQSCCSSPLLFILVRGSLSAGGGKGCKSCPPSSLSWQILVFNKEVGKWRWGEGVAG